MFNNIFGKEPARNKTGKTVSYRKNSEIHSAVMGKYGMIGVKKKR